ncbi:hypothetical protein KUCAC02_026350 [Chaenocephalus aceratus]|uniref:Uncharacterized protein n=1 Tax=Chaenocephalus aceratus TaxID=36190 RepID=A0ACB9VX79_CHAAC|nr:hypothetical protein KUCAC02_026350 [Chaenocephalus aceratus]
MIRVCNSIVLSVGVNARHVLLSGYHSGTTWPNDPASYWSAGLWLNLLQISCEEEWGGGFQNSPTGEQLDLKRRLVPPACLCV